MHQRLQQRFAAKMQLVVRKNSTSERSVWFQIPSAGAETWVKVRVREIDDAVDVVIDMRIPSGLIFERLERKPATDKL